MCLHVCQVLTDLLDDHPGSGKKVKIKEDTQVYHYALWTDMMQSCCIEFVFKRCVSIAWRVGQLQ